MKTRRSRWTGDISKNAVTAFPGNSETSFLGSPPLIGGQWRGLHSQGNCHLPSRVNRVYLCNILFNLVFFSPEKCRAMWSWGLQGSRIQVHKSQVVNEQNSDFSSIVLDPLPYLVVSNATRRYFIFSLWCFNHHIQHPWFSLNRLSQERPCQAIRSSQSCLDTWWQRGLHWRNHASENIAKPDIISNNRHHFHFQSDDGDKAVVLLGHENKHFKSEQVTNN